MSGLKCSAILLFLSSSEEFPEQVIVEHRLHKSADPRPVFFYDIFSPQMVDRPLNLVRIGFFDAMSGYRGDAL